MWRSLQVSQRGGSVCSVKALNSSSSKSDSCRAQMIDPAVPMEHDRHHVAKSGPFMLHLRYNTSLLE